MRPPTELLDLFVLAGEASGDAHGAAVLQELRTLAPQWRIAGVGGPLMRDHGLHVLQPMEDFQVMGFSDIALSLPRLYRQFRCVRNYILTHNPPATLLIDYPGFNLRLAKALRKQGYEGKIAQLVCPTVWAWGRGRIKTMVDTMDLLLTIFPFEAQYFTGTRLPVQYVGHPAANAINRYTYYTGWMKEVGIDDADQLIGIFPGSRRSELLLNLPKQLETAHHFLKQHPHVRFCISCAHDEYTPLIAKILNEHEHKLPHKIPIVPKRYTYELMRYCSTALATSGTVTLELALHQTPTVTVYEVSATNSFLVRYIFRIRLPHYCIVNILANDTVFPELIAVPFTPDLACHHLDTLHTNAAARRRCLDSCQQIIQQLRCDNSSVLAARAIERLVIQELH